MSTGKVIPSESYVSALKHLAEVSAIAFSLKNDLAPLSQDDIQAGAEPLTQGQIQESLDRIQSMIVLLVLHDLGATREEWHAAEHSVQ